MAKAIFSVALRFHYGNIEPQESTIVFFVTGPSDNAVAVPIVEKSGKAFAHTTILKHDVSVLFHGKLRNALNNLPPEIPRCLDQ